MEWERDKAVLRVRKVKRKLWGNKKSKMGEMKLNPNLKSGEINLEMVIETYRSQKSRSPAVRRKQSVFFRMFRSCKAV